MLPQIKGIPVIVLSAKADVSDKVGLLRGGAADYITKPFDMSELLARIDVQLRKTAQPAEESLLRFNELSLNIDTHTLSANGEDIKLTKTEFAIIKLLMLNPGRVGYRFYADR